MFLDVLNRLRACVFVDIKHDQTQRHLQRCSIGHVALLTFFNIVFRFFKLVLYVLEDGSLVEILDRENRLKDALNAVTICRGVLIAGAQEKIV